MKVDRCVALALDGVEITIEDGVVCVPKIIVYFLICTYEGGKKPQEFCGGGEGSNHAITIIILGFPASHILRPIQQYNI